jgi:hypothetical protein
MNGGDTRFKAARGAMRIVVLLIALVIIVMGVVGVVAPDTVMAMRLSMWRRLAGST